MVEINVTVMTSTFWPSSYSGSTCKLPPELLQACNSFDCFYNTRYSGRRLTWQPALGNADVRIAFKSKKHEVNVATFALVILLQFKDLSEDDFLTYEVHFISLLSMRSLNTFRMSKTRLRCLMQNFNDICNPLRVQNTRYLRSILRRETFRRPILSLSTPILPHPC